MFSSLTILEALHSATALASTDRLSLTGSSSQVAEIPAGQATDPGIFRAQCAQELGILARGRPGKPTVTRDGPALNLVVTEGDGHDRAVSLSPAVVARAAGVTLACG